MILICCCGLCFLIGALLFKNCFNDVRKYWNASSWPKKEARITSTQVSDYDNPQAERTEWQRSSALDNRKRRVTVNRGEPDTYFSIAVRYQYDVNGQLYHGEVHDAPHRTREIAEHAASTTYSQGDTIEIAYDPVQPENHWAHGDPNPVGVATGGMVIGVVFMLPFLAYVSYKLYGTLQKKSRSSIKNSSGLRYIAYRVKQQPKRRKGSSLIDRSHVRVLVRRGGLPAGGALLYLQRCLPRKGTAAPWQNLFEQADDATAAD